MVAITKPISLEDYPEEYKELLSTLHLDEVGNYLKSDLIIVMVGLRSFNSLKRKRDKVVEVRKTVRSRMRLLVRMYLRFKVCYGSQDEVTLSDMLNNSGDMFRKETIFILNDAINDLCEKPNEETIQNSTSNQKSGLKVNILNSLKLCAQIIIGHFTVKNENERVSRINEFLNVLKLLENEFFGDAYYDLNYRRNRTLRKPINMPKDDDVQALMVECRNIMSSIDRLNIPSEEFVKIRSAVATYLIIFCARRGGEPVRLQLYQWDEAVKGEWTANKDIPEDFDKESMLITFQTGKGSDHLVPVIFPDDCIEAMKYLTNKSIRSEAGVRPDNPYIFASTRNSKLHINGWHCINDILKILNKTGTINATRNRHHVASLLAKLSLSEKDQELIFKHFGHSKSINEHVYQAPPGSMQLTCTGKHLKAIHGLKEAGNGK